MRTDCVKHEFTVFKIGNLYVEDLSHSITLTPFYDKAKEFDITSPIFAMKYRKMKYIIEKNGLGKLEVFKISKELTVNEYHANESEIQKALEIEEDYLKK